MSNGIQDIEKRLENLKKNLQTTEDDISNKSKERDIINTDITNLKKKLSEIKQITDAYGKVYIGFDAERKALNEYAATKKKIIDGALQESDKKDIDQIIADFKSNKSDKEDNVRNQEKKYETSKIKSENTKKDLENKQKKFDSFKTYQNEIGDNLKSLKALKETIEKEQDRDNFKNMYFWINEFNNIVNSVNLELKDADTFASEYTNSEKELYEAGKKYREIEEEMNFAKSNLDIAQKELDLLNKSRIEKILNEISAIKSDKVNKKSDSANKVPDNNNSCENSDNKK